MTRVLTRSRSLAWLLAAAALLCFALRATPARADLPTDDSGAYVIQALSLTDAPTFSRPTMMGW